MTIRPGLHFLREIALVNGRQPRPGRHLRLRCFDIKHQHRFFSVRSKTRQAEMARLNTHHSATPLQTRSSTVDSLYRDPSVAPRNASSARGTTYSVMSPSQSSDKENMHSDSREGTPQPAKRKGLSNASGRIPTPDTGSTVGSTSNKRRRTEDYNLNGESEIFEDEDEEEDEEDEEDEAERPQRRRTATTQPEEEEEDGQSKLYNPNQDPNKRREVRYQLRENHRQLEGECSRILCAGSTANQAQITAASLSKRTTMACTSSSKRTIPPLERCGKRQMRQSTRGSLSLQRTSRTRSSRTVFTVAVAPASTSTSLCPSAYTS